MENFNYASKIRRIGDLSMIVESYSLNLFEEEKNHAKMWAFHREEALASQPSNGALFPKISDAF